MARPVRWALVYMPTSAPIGWISRRPDGFHAKTANVDLGVHATAQDAAAAVWQAFLAAGRARHEAAAKTHGAERRARRAEP